MSKPWRIIHVQPSGRREESDGSGTSCYSLMVVPVNHGLDPHNGRGLLKSGGICPTLTLMAHQLWHFLVEFINNKPATNEAKISEKGGVRYCLHRLLRASLNTFSPIALTYFQPSIYLCL